MHDVDKTPDCRDCGVEPGRPHLDGCGVARCTACGFQRISCEHDDSDVGWGHAWSGHYPGDDEIAEGLAADRNDLQVLARRGWIRWDGNRWQPNDQEA